MNAQAALELGKSIVIQSAGRNVATSVNATVSAAPTTRGAEVVFQGAIATVDYYDQRVATYNLWTNFATSTGRNKVVSVPANKVKPVMKRVHSLRDPGRYRAPHWTQARHRGVGKTRSFVFGDICG